MGKLGKTMLDFTKKYGSNVYSQNGEDGIVTEVLKRLKMGKGVAVEFGGADGFFCSNTAFLRDAGWGNVFMYDLQATKYVEQRTITPENVNELPKCDVLSIDIDGNDYAVWREYEGKPAIVVIEINSSYKPGKYIISDPAEGTSYTPMVELGLSKGYFLLCHTGNLVFVDNKYRKLFPEVVKDGLQNPEDYFKNDWL
jgi:hypothetical protein